MQKNLIYIGHRGTNVDADENTIGAFNKVIKVGADHIEFDIRMTKDNKFIVMHNPSIDELTDDSGYIKDFTYDELKKIKTKNSKEEIPSLEKVFDEFKKNKKIKFIIDIKERGISSKVLEIANKKQILNNCILCSANFKDLLLAKKKFPESKICYVIYRKKILINVINKIQTNKMPFKIDMLSLAYNLIKKSITKICHENNILSLAWGFRYIKEDRLNKIKSIIKNDIDGIIFDNYKNIPKIKKWINKY